MAWTKPAPSGKVKGCWRDHTGKERSRTFATKTEALKYARKMEVEIDSGVRRDAMRSRVRFGDYLREWRDLRAGMYRPGSLRNIDLGLAHHVFGTRLERLRLGEITLHDIKLWIAERQAADVSPWVIRNVFAFVRLALADAVSSDWIAKNPALGAKLPAVPTKRQRTLTPDEMFAVADAVPQRYRAPVLFLGFAGTRVGEMCGVAVEDIDFDGGLVWVRRQLHEGTRIGPPKNKNRVRTPVRLVPWLLDELRAHIDAGYTARLDGLELVFSGAPHGGDDRMPEWAGGRDPLDLIAEAKAQGKSMRALARELGVGERTVDTYAKKRRQWLERFGGPVRPGQPLNDRTFWTVVSRTTAQIGMDHFRVHDLRGSCASAMLAAGVPVTIVAEQLGDTVDVVVARYLRTTEEATREALMSWDAATRREQLRPVLRPVAALPA